MKLTERIRRLEHGRYAGDDFDVQASRYLPDGTVLWNVYRYDGPGVRTMVAQDISEAEAEHFHTTWPWDPNPSRDAVTP